MWLDRSLIKQQAKQIIKHRTLKLFAVSFIITLILSLGQSVYLGVYINDIDNLTNYYEDFSDDNYGDYEDYFNDNFGTDSNSRYADDFNNFGSSDSNSQYADDFNNFGTAASGSQDAAPVTAESAQPNQSEPDFTPAMKITGSLNYIYVILLAPLSVALSYYFVELVNGKDYEFVSGLKSIFRNAFKVTYLKKIAVFLLRMIIYCALSILLFVPGIIFLYSSYFVNELMSEYPELSPWQAIMLSKKIVKGHRTELFVLDLSFIPWYMLCIFLFPIIYVYPYIYTTQALYYENFKRRALATGAVTEDDFLSEAQRMSKMYATANGYQNQQGGNYQQQGQPYQQPMQGAPYQQYGYNQPPQQAQPYQQPMQGAPYQQPMQSAPYQQQYGNNYQSQNTNNTAPYQQYGNNYQSPDVYNPNSSEHLSEYSSVFFIPVMPEEQKANSERDLYNEFNKNSENKPPQNVVQTQNTVQQTKIEAGEKPQITVTKPEEPKEPDFAEMQKPTENFTEPTEPREPEEPQETVKLSPEETQQTEAAAQDEKSNDADSGENNSL